MHIGYRCKKYSSATKSKYLIADQVSDTGSGEPLVSNGCGSYAHNYCLIQTFIYFR